MTEHIARVHIAYGIDIVKKLNEEIQVVIRTDDGVHSWTIYHPEWAKDDNNIELKNWADNVFLHSLGYSE